MISIGFGGIGMFMAIRTGSGEAVQGMFPLLFVLLFFSSISMPRDLIQQDWFRTIATINPVSYLLEGIRSLYHLSAGTSKRWRWPSESRRR